MHAAKISPLRMRLWFLDKILRLPLIRSYFYSEKLKAYYYLSCSRTKKKQHFYSKELHYSFKNSPERILKNKNIRINLIRNSDTFETYRKLANELQIHFLAQGSAKSKEVSYKVAISTSKSLLTTNQNNIINNEIYRFVQDPALHFPGILDLLLSSEFRHLFENYHPQIKIAGINLRLSSPSNSEAHTTSFHRDYNRYYTLKVFIPLSLYKTPFLEYIPSTELVSTGNPHYRPKHVDMESLPKRIQKLYKSYTSVDISNLRIIPTNTIHREQPSNETRLNLIITYLSHPDYGLSHPNALLNQLKLRSIDDWTTNHLSLFNAF